MFRILLALHVLTAIFAIGPLVHAATTASRGLRTGDAGATSSSARTVTLYSYVSVVVVVLGFGLMSSKNYYTGQRTAEFTELWIWLSAVLWLAGVALALSVIAPALQSATTRIGAGEPVEPLIGKVASAGGIVGLIFAAIVFLMVYRPGS